MESTLSVALPDVVSRVGAHLGYGRGPDHKDTVWNTRQADAIRDVWTSGLRKFYHCGYEWSFLKPAETVVIASGTNETVLPADFAGFEGEVWISSPAAQSKWWGMKPVLDETVLQQRAALPDTTGRPKFVACTPVKGTTAKRGQQQKVIVWPKADQAYTLQCRFNLLPDALTDQMPYAYGGGQHGETILESCLAAADLIRFQRTAEHAAEFLRLLEVSKQLDKRLKPQALGRNGGGQDWYAAGRRSGTTPRAPWGWDLPGVTYNGASL